MSRLARSALGLLLATTAAPAQADRNAAYLDQHGQGNYVSQQQLGYLNQVEAYQWGSRLSLTTIQQGTGNRIDSLQSGDQLRSVVEQYGDHNRAHVQQGSAAPPIVIRQVGTGMAISISR